MKLIQQFRPFTTRDSSVRIPPRNIALIALSEGNKTALERVYVSDNSPLVGSLIACIPIHDCGLTVPTNEIQKLKRESKRPIFLNLKQLKTRRSAFIDLSFVYQRLEKRGIKQPFNKKYVEFTKKCLTTLSSKLTQYDHRILYDVIDLSDFRDQTISQSTFRYMRLFSIFSLLKDDSFKEWFDEAYGEIFVTFKLVTGEFINVKIYDKSYEQFSKPETVLPRFLTMFKLYARTHQQDDEIDRKVTKIVEKLPRVIHDRETRQIVATNIRQFANKYPDEIEEVKDVTEKQVKLIAAKAVKATVSNDSYVDDKEVNEILKTLTEIQIPPATIPEEITDEDRLSKIRKVASPPQVGNVMESRKQAFQNLESFVKIYNTYFKRIGFRVVSVDRKPVETRDITKTEQELLEITIEDLKDGKLHKVELLIPKIVDDNYFYIGGVKRVLIHQLFPLPVVSYRTGEAIIRTNFANATITLETRFKIKSFYAVVLGKKIPVVLLLILYHKSLGNLLKEFKIQYKETDKPEGDFSIPLANGRYISFYKLTPEQKILLQGLQTIKQFPESDTYEEWLKVTSNLVSHRFAKQVESYFDRFLDPITFYILTTENLPTTVDGLIWYACLLAYSGIVTSQTDLRYRRIRSVEVFAILIYKRLYFELYKHRLRELMSFGEKKTKQSIKIPKDALLDDLTMTDAQSQYQQLDPINPVIESSYVTRVTYAGYGGVKSENVPPTMRNVDPTYFGTICPVDTPECLDINTLVYRWNDEEMSYEPVRIMDLQIGDYIKGSNGKPVKVKDKWITYKQAVMLEFDDSTVVIASLDHRFPVIDLENNEQKLVTVKEIIEEPERFEFIQI